MDIKIALAGNPNSGKTTLFNDLTGSNQYVGNWPGVTVEKKEGRLKGHKDIVIQDLPGIYSLSPYTLEEVVARNYLVNEKPDAILNIVDGTNIERNLYLTTQLIELGLPVVVAVNMMDLVRKNGDRIDAEKLGEALGCDVVEISALKGEGGAAAAEKAARLGQQKRAGELPHVFTGSVEHAIAHIEESIQGMVDERYLRWYAVKVFERDEKVLADLELDEGLRAHLERHIADGEKELDDDAESIITNQRYASPLHIRQGRPDRHQPHPGPADLRRGDVRGVLDRHGPLRHLPDGLDQRRAGHRLAGGHPQGRPGGLGRQ